MAKKKKKKNVKTVLFNYSTIQFLVPGVISAD